MVYTSALQAPNRQQWEHDSAPSQSWNCGPTCVAFIAGFYRDTRFGIEQGRHIIGGLGPYNVNGTTVWGCPPQMPTTAWQQADILTRRGVPATVRQIDSLSQLHSLVDSGRRPVLVGIEMWRVSWSVRGHPFTGWHAVVVVSGAYVNGIRGFWVMDPNFPPGGPSRRFYSDAVMQWAFISHAPRWSVIPSSAKAVTAPAASTIGGMPVSFTPRPGWSATLIGGKPMRAGKTLASRNYGYAPKDVFFNIWAETAGESVAGSTRWFVGALYIRGWKVVYVPLVDLKNRRFR